VRLFTPLAYLIYPAGSVLFAYAGALLVTLDQHFNLAELTCWAPRRLNAVILPRFLWLVLFTLALPQVALLLLHFLYLKLPLPVLWLDLVLTYHFFFALGAFFALGLRNDLSSLFAVTIIAVLLSISPASGGATSSLNFTNQIGRASCRERV